MLLGLALLGAGVTGCFRPQGRVRLASVSSPTVVPHPDQGTCDAETLAKSAPWSGRIVERRPSEVEENGARTVRTDWALCGDLDEKACAAWALRYGKARAASEGLEVSVVPGRSRRGKLWVVAIDETEEAHLFPTNRDFVSFFRGTERTGKRISLVSSDTVVETRWGRVEIRYQSPVSAQRVPSSAWLVEMESDPQSVLEANMALEDLGLKGVELTPQSWEAISEAQYWLAPRAAPVLEPRTQPAHAHPIQIWVEARCAVR